MLGGELDVTFQSGNLRAWLTAGADVIVHWSPFWFDAHVWISVGVSYRLDLLFTSVTLSVEIGADLELWGPPTGGTVTVDCFVAEISIPFGSSGPQVEAASWETVKKMLGEDSASISVVAGLTTPAAVSAAADEPWIVRGGSFAFTTASPVPASRMKVGEKTYDEGFAALDVRPLEATGLSSTHTLTVTDAEKASDDVSGAFEVEPVLASVPTSLWGKPADDATVPSGGAQLVGEQAVGLKLTVKPPVTGSTAGPVDVEGALAHDDLGLARAVLPIWPGAAPAGPSAKIDPRAIDAVVGATGISSQEGIAARTALLSGLAAAGVNLPAGANPSAFSAGAGTFLSAEPMLAVPG
jgi:hypothetical protein